MENLSGENSVLSGGLLQLCQNDSDVERLVGPRREETLSLLEKYIAEIELFNPAYGLVGTSDRRELVVRHILDSLAPLGSICRLLPAYSQGAAGNAVPRIGDVGSGAGLPGIPLAIALPRVNFTLIERKGRRAGFLRNALAALGLPNVSVEECEMEKAAAGRFDMVVFRALSPLEPKILKKLLKLCNENGMLAAYKGRREKIEGEMAAITNIVKNIEIVPCRTPFLDEERHMLFIYGQH